MRLLQEDTLLLGIDYQEKLIPGMDEKDTFLTASAKLFRGAYALGVPVLLTVQYLKGLGPTVAEIKAVTEGAARKDQLQRLG